MNTTALRSKFKHDKEFRDLFIKQNNRLKNYHNNIIKKFLEKNYKGKKLPINIQELLESQLFATSYNHLLKYKNIKKIKIDSKIGKRIGFTSDKFINKYSLVCLLNSTVLILAIESLEKRKGNFTNFINNILKFGYDFIISQPFYEMLKWTQKNQPRLQLKTFTNINLEVERVSNKWDLGKKFRV